MEQKGQDSLLIPNDTLQITDDGQVEIPKTLPILPVSGFVVFPSAVGPIAVRNPAYARMINEIAVKDRLLGIALTRDNAPETPGQQDLYRVGAAVRILKLMNINPNELSFICQGIARIDLVRFMQTEPHMVADVSQRHDVVESKEELEPMMNTLRNQFLQLVDLSPQLPEQLKLLAVNLKDYTKLIDFVVANCSAEASKQQMVLEERSVGKRFKIAMTVVQTEIQKTELSNKIQSEIAQEISQQQREHLLRQQLKKIQAELGEKDDQAIEIDALRKKIADAKMPEEAARAANKEVDRLAMMSPAAAEYSVSRTYLDWLTEMPWSTSTRDRLDIAKAEKILDADHYDLEKVKKRIIEYIAVRKLKKGMKGPILCFYGPPGVGKTSLGKSIARALGRKFIRLSLGGVRDEAEIRGHRRTYVGALPGRIIQGIKKAGTINPLFMLDEVDKLGTDFRGDPSSALLEVLDPEQNNSFSDHYLEVSYDLSNVFFITTANVVETIPPALKDRLEILGLPGYTEDEKLHIARKYIIPRQIHGHGLRLGDTLFQDAAVRKIIRGYTREAGVRNLEREIASVCRGIARQVAQGAVKKVSISDKTLEKYLGQSKFFSELAERITAPGIATGLAWTPAGGDILFVEASKMSGNKGLLLTGQLGDVMKESAQAGLSYVRSNARQLGISPNFFNKLDLHLHVPAGAIPKDGPSAGVTMVCALTSLLTGIPVQSDVAMTGEITLRGKVMPVGGIKEKVLAAKRAGITRVILPKLNKKDLDDAPAAAKKGMEFVFVDRIDEVIQAALTKKKKTRHAGDVNNTGTARHANHAE